MPLLRPSILELIGICLSNKRIFLKFPSNFEIIKKFYSGEDFQIKDFSYF